MNDPRFIGIDGGGSTLRIAVVNARMGQLSAIRAGSVNPSVVGLDAARERIQVGIRAALSQADTRPAGIAAAGIGIAGASNLHSEAWLRQTLKPVLPASVLVPSSDLEIALVGALAQRRGILLLAGTGSGAYGLNRHGARLQVGGWGYLLGDEGGSYWIGRELLRQVIRESDLGAEARDGSLNRACLDALGLSQTRDLVAWVYRSEATPTARIGGLATLVLERADEGDEKALAILRRAAAHLADQVETLRRRLQDPAAPIAFAGGLLDNGNWLSAAVTGRLALAKRPVAIHPPVIGAALLAKMKWSAANR